VWRSDSKYIYVKAGGCSSRHTHFQPPFAESGGGEPMGVAVVSARGDETCEAGEGGGGAGHGGEELMVSSTLLVGN